MVAKMTWKDRIENYHRETGFPESLFIGGDGRCVGIWIMGNDYRVKSKYYGGYPAGYLRRVKALFPDKERVLHLFSGKVDTEAYPGVTVDINAANNPDIVDNAETLTKVPVEEFDLILADPPYSAEDCEHYGTCMVNRNRVVDALQRRINPDCHVFWLDQVQPMYRKTEVRAEAFIGVVKSTMHRYRCIAGFGRATNHCV